MKDTVNPMDVMIGARIRVRRMQLGISQTELGEHLKVSFQQIQKYERGLNRVAASRITSIATFLKVPSTYFFSGEVSGEGGVPVLDDSLIALMGEQTKEAQRLLMAFAQIKGAKNRMKVVAIVEAVAAGFVEASASGSCADGGVQ